MERTCLKCGNKNRQATGAELEPCPVCGAIYSRVEAARAARGPEPAPAGAPVAAVAASTPTQAPQRPPATPTSGPYLEQLRASSNYPTFRSVVGVFAVVGYLLAALVAVGAAFSLVKVNIGAGLLGLAFALFIVVMTRMGKEMSLMVADGSDALVRMAALQESR